MAIKSPLFSTPAELRKGERTRLHVLESAFLCIARDGYYRTTFQTIANHARLSQPLIVKMFGTREAIFPTVATYLLKVATEATVIRVRDVPIVSLRQKIEAYFEVSLELMIQNPDLAKFYMNIYYLASYDPSIRKFNQAMRAQAITRLEGFLREGEKQKHSVAENRHLATALHDYLTGSILNTISLATPWDKKRVLKNLHATFFAGLNL